jgi:hypothetical protein
MTIDTSPEALAKAVEQYEMRMFRPVTFWEPASDLECPNCGELNVFARRWTNGEYSYECRSCQDIWWGKSTAKGEGE